MGGVRKERYEGLKYHQRTSHEQGCGSLLSMSWLRDLMGFSLAYPNLFGTKGFVVVVLWSLEVLIVPIVHYYTSCLVHIICPHAFASFFQPLLF
jgi:hypothetical protein